YGIIKLILTPEFRINDFKHNTCNPQCPLNSECVNATACRCKPGFASSSTEIFTDPLEICEDINECLLPQKVSCGYFADCHNVQGSYYCTCSPGFELLSGAKTFSNASENTCQDKAHPAPCSSGHQNGGEHWSWLQREPTPLSMSPDVDECSSGQHKCHHSTTCTNTCGWYWCYCLPGWEPIPGSINGMYNNICKGTQPALTPEPPPPHTHQLSGSVLSAEWSSFSYGPFGPSPTALCPYPSRGS
uniref:EGF-like domain-containing protein n=1 Tax=Marmota marmota marmota TaxID=9994 RepID=A0A8C6A818_MARMA